MSDFLEIRQEGRPSEASICDEIHSRGPNLKQLKHCCGVYVSSQNLRMKCIFSALGFRGRETSIEVRTGLSHRRN